MKINKELKYNIIIITTLFLIDFVWDEIIQNKDAQYHLKSPYIILQFTSMLSMIVVYVLNYLVFTPWFLAKKKYLHYFFSFLLMILIFAVTRYTLEEIIFFHFTGLHNYNIEGKDLIINYLFDSFYYTFRFSLYSSVVYLLFRYIENKDKILALNTQHQEAKMMALKSQISPHFLFNTLNSFYSELFDEKPETAKDILKLSQLLRYVTYEATQNYMPLQKEIDFIQDYLYFYKKRYEDNYFVALTIDGKVANQQIPSLILIHFVENVSKHGIINDPNHPAKININITEDALEISTQNKINISEKYESKGIGTQNIKNRLTVLFNDKFQFNTSKENNIFKTYLKMPLVTK